MLRDVIQIHERLRAETGAEKLQTTRKPDPFSRSPRKMMSASTSRKGPFCFGRKSEKRLPTLAADQMSVSSFELGEPGKSLQTERRTQIAVNKRKENLMLMPYTKENTREQLQKMREDTDKVSIGLAQRLKNSNPAVVDQMMKMQKWQKLH